jgi:hypothetical protein
MCSLKSFYLEINNDIPDITLVYNNKEIQLNSKEIFLLLTYKKCKTYKFTFHKPIKCPNNIETENKLNYYFNRNNIYSCYNILPIRTIKDYYIFNYKNKKPEFIIYSFGDEIKKQYVYTNYIKIPKKNNNVPSIILYYKYMNNAKEEA